MSRNIILVFNGSENVFPISGHRTFQDMAGSYPKFAELMREGVASFFLNKANYSLESSIPTEVEIDSMVAQKRLTNPSYLFDSSNLKFLITPSKVKQGFTEEELKEVSMVIEAELSVDRLQFRRHLRPRFYYMNFTANHLVCN